MLAAAYVQHIYGYLPVLADNIVKTPVTLVDDLLIIERPSGPKNLVPALRRITWYRHMMLMGRVIFYCD